MLRCLLKVRLNAFSTSLPHTFSTSIVSRQASMNTTLLKPLSPLRQNFSMEPGILVNSSNANVSESVSEESFAQWELIVIAIFAGTLAFVTMFGNLLVIISFGINPKLRILNNYFLASLSVADFSIGLVSMPLYTTYVLVGYWPFGALPCDLWLSMDYVMSNSSALHLLVICIDRYLTVKRPLTYRANKTSGKLLRMIILVWIISIILWVPWIFAFPYIEGGRTVPDDDCYIQFIATNPYMTVVTHVLAYWLPIFGMMVFYQRVYHVTAKHVAFKSNFKVRRGDTLCGSTAELVTIPHGGRGLQRSVSADSSISTISNASVCTGHKDHHNDKESDKAAKTLSAILLAFILTWTPYHVNVMISTACDTCVPPSVFNFGYWLCYINSTINPFLYCLCNEQFRWTFIRILTCNRKDPGRYRASQRAAQQISSHHSGFTK